MVLQINVSMCFTFSCFYDVISVCFLSFVSVHLMSYCNFVSAHEGRCKCTISALPSCSYLFAFVVAKYYFERNKWIDGEGECWMSCAGWLYSRLSTENSVEAAAAEWANATKY